MVFSSISFLFFFLPVTITIFFAIPKRFRNFFLLISSLFFYWWGEKELVLLLLLSVILNYIFGLLIQHTRRHRRMIFVLGVVINLSFLFFYKYANFFMDNFNEILGFLGWRAIKMDSIHLPIGISFFTFQALSYLIDIYRKQALPQGNPVNIGLYISLFPQLIAGPIVRYNDIAPQLMTRKFSMEKFSRGIKRFILGLSKKVLFANTMAVTVDQIFATSAADLTALEAWIGILAYALQIYFDFSGYSDMAIGLGHMFGFTFLENFNFPYISRSITEFWKRWHISLSTWLRDYLFLPIVYGIFRKTKKEKVLKIRLDFFGYSTGMLITMFLGGLWHGASWNFVIWGMLHGVFSVLEKTVLKKKLKHALPAFQYTYTLGIVLIAWVFFRSPSLEYSIDFLGKLFFIAPGRLSVGPQFISNKFFVLLIIGMAACTPVFMILKERTRAWLCRSLSPVLGGTCYEIASMLSYFILLVTSSSFLAAGTYNPFIYFRF